MMINRAKKFSVLILAAGNSIRMGSPKFFLKFDDTRCFLQKIMEDYQFFGCSEIKVVLNINGERQLKENKAQFIENEHIIINEHPEWERFYSIKTGVKALHNPDLIFIHHVDNPLVSFEVLNSLLKQQNNGEYVVPTYKGKGGHPILIGSKIIEKINCIIENDLNFKIFLKDFVRENVEVSNRDILLNINTLDDYSKFLIR